MQNNTQMTVRCSSCGQPFNTPVYSLIDVAQVPQLKAQLLSGRLNRPQCPHCGTANALATPILYHDASKELLIALIPMELNLAKDQQEKAIGDLMNRLPKENFKSYMFNPRRALTMQGLVDQILEADGVTPAMMQEQRERLNLIQQLVETPPDKLAALVKQNDNQIDESFLQAMTLMARRMFEDGRPDVAQAIMMRQSEVAQHSSYGQRLVQKQQEQESVIQEVVQAIDALGEQANQDDLLKLAISYTNDEERLQALVGLVRPAFDDEFFQQLTLLVGQAPAHERDAIEGLRQHLLDLTAAVDQQAQMAMQNAAGFLQAAVNHPTPEEFIHQNIHMVDDMLMSVLAANIDHAEKQNDSQMGTRLKQIYQIIVNILQDNMQPELRFVNQLLSAPNESEAISLLKQQGKQYGKELVEVMNAVEEVLTNQGDDTLIKRLRTLRDQLPKVLEL